MEKTDKRYTTYVQILKEELVPAMGCTEPIAIAYAAAKAREVLGKLPSCVEIGVSDNIIKNVKSVVVPNTDGMKGIEAAAYTFFCYIDAMFVADNAIKGIDENTVLGHHGVGIFWNITEWTI